MHAYDSLVSKMFKIRENFEIWINSMIKEKLQAELVISLTRKFKAKIWGVIWVFTCTAGTICCIICTVVVYPNEIIWTFNHQRLLFSKFWKSFSNIFNHFSWVATKTDWFHKPDQKAMEKGSKCCFN